ncbi:hypothetical protein DPMN_169453 [Dreissena polymorpha]|uniref:Uncharacterized protein n=1 Tax=Dreissena polymorpha TaxID=45954 RepID=A0A9D4DV99_DREPO|nr:hypothetical protein DPMN_169453 [Dreissena polymorpha]
MGAGGLDNTGPLFGKIGLGRTGVLVIGGLGSLCKAFTRAARGRGVGLLHPYTPWCTCDGHSDNNYQSLSPINTVMS